MHQGDRQMINRIFLFIIIFCSAPVVADNTKVAETVDLKTPLGSFFQIYSPEYIYSDNLVIIPDGKLLSYDYFNKKNNEELINQLENEILWLAVVVKRNDKTNSDSFDVLTNKLNDIVESVINIEKIIEDNRDQAEDKIKELAKAQVVTQNETNSKILIVESKYNTLDSYLNTLRSKVNVVEGNVKDDIGRVKNELVLNTESLREEIFVYIILFLVFSFIVTLILMVLAIFFKRKLAHQKSEFSANLGGLKNYFDESYAGLDGRLLEIISSKVEPVNSSQDRTGKEKDHSLVIKVADEVVRIEHNISRMDKKTKGLKQLSASVTRIKDNFHSNGYEIVEMLGEKYSNGYRASVEFVDDENLEPGEQIISRVIKPQINYQGLMVQSAQIEVSQGA